MVVFCAGLDGSIELEGRDRPFDLPYGQDMLIQELVKVNPKLIVAIHAGGGINMTRWIDQVPAVVHAQLHARHQPGDDQRALHKREGHVRTISST